MKVLKCLPLVSSLALTCLVANAATLSTAFTYQGRLTAGTNAANGIYDLKFSLYDAINGGTQVGSGQTNTATGVTNGYFTVSLDFGSAFDGNARWLETAVRTNGVASFSTLTPRQPIAAAPYATYAPGAGVAAGVSAGAITAAMIADGAVTTAKIGAAAVKPVNLDDGGGGVYEDLLGPATAMGTATPLPFRSLSPVSRTAEPSFSFSLDGEALGTVVGFFGREAMSEPYEFVVEVVLPGPDLSPDAQLGRQARVTFGRSGRSTSFAGIVSGCSLASYDGKTALYSFRLESPLAYLALKSDYRIHRNTTVPSLASALYQAVATNTNAVRLSLAESYDQREFVMQFGEADLNYLSRLLENDGIFYFFSLSGTPPTLILGDSPSAYLQASNSPFSYFGNRTTEVPSATEWIRTFGKGVHQSTLKSSLNSYDFEKPNTSLLAAQTSTIGGFGETYDLAGYTTPAEGKRLAKLRQERVDVERAALAGSSTAPDLRPGTVFTLDDRTSSGLSGDYLVTSVRHAAFRRVTNGVTSLYYGNQFEVIPANLPFRPARRATKPVARACTAVVSGKTGEEIWVDKYGRVKVQFHWDRYGAKDENASAWLRVASPWAGASWGAIFTPRIGQEVLVEFVNGDPDQPVITGSFYNDTHMPPYELPANATRSGVKTRSSKGGTSDNYNEIRFEDKKGSEQLFIHAEKNFDREVENDMTSWVGHDLTAQVDHDSTSSVGHDLTISAGNDLKITSSRGVGINTANDPAFALKVGGTVSATAFQGNGSGLTAVSADLLDGQHGAFYQNAGNLNAGTLTDTRLSTNVARLNAGQTFLGNNSFLASVGIGTAVGSDVLNIGGNARLNDSELFFRGSGDLNHGLGWYGAGKLFGGVNVDGPVLYGCDGGGLGTGCGQVLALRWRNDGNVMIDPTSLNSGALLPGLTFGSFSGEGIASKRTAGGNQYGLDFYTYGTNRLSITQGGKVGIGKSNPAVALDVVGSIRTTGAVRSGSEVGAAAPGYPSGSDGLVIRRVRSTATTAGSIVARTDKLTLERDGTSAGLRLTYPASPGRQVINCIGINTNGTQVVYRNALSSPATGASLTLFANTQRIVHYDISFGDTYSTTPGHTTHVVLDRYDDGTTSDAYLVGTITSTYDQ